MAKSIKTNNETSKQTVNNPAQVLPAPAVDDATTTKGTKAKPIASDPDEGTNSKTAVFAALRAWLGLDSDTAKANTRAAELIAAGVAPLDAVKQATKENRGRGSESCTVSAFIAEIEQYPNIQDVYNILNCDGFAVGEGKSDTMVTTYHAPGDDDNDDDNEGGYSIATATATVLGVTFTETYRYKVRPATWLACFQALKSCDMPRQMAAKAARRGKDLRKQARSLSDIFDKMLSMGADPAKIREYIPAWILEAE